LFIVRAPPAGALAGQAAAMPTLLHVHGWYSLLEGTSSPEALLDRAAAYGYTALALTDTNNLYGAIPVVNLAHRRGLRPLLGACLRQHRSRCVALVADRAGYRNLCRVLSRLHLAGPDGPQLADLLRDHGDGLHVLVDDLVLAERLRAAFGPRLWLEVVRPPRSAAQQRELLEHGLALGLRPIASTAVHLATPDDYPAFRLVTAVRQATLLDRLPRRLTITPAHHLVDLAELARRFRDLPEAVRNTDLLADQLRSDVLPCDTVLPPARLRPGLDAVPYLRLLCERGLRRRDLAADFGARQRLREELKLIEMAGLSSYFLVVRDIARYARRQGHSMALRGSAGNSLACFLLEITDVNPLRFGLPLERFLHPGRADLPDIDLDFDWKVRDDVIAHVVRRWGQSHAAQISSHLFLQPRSAFREAAKLHGLSNEQVTRLLETAGREESTRRAAPPPGFPLEPERWPRIVTAARLLLGRPHHLSIHPGGVVLTPRPIEEYVPLQPAAKGVVITQFEKDAIESVGLVKIDLLGNRALATVDEARALAGERRGLPPPSEPPGQARRLADTRLRGPLLSPVEDPAVLDLLRRGDTLGVNQLESPALRHLLIQMRPAAFDDVAQALALIRPAAASIGAKESFVRRRRGLEPVATPHPLLGPVLRDTQGLMLYEDDALRVIRALTGLAAEDADRLRKRITKYRTDAEALALSREFLTACARRGVPRGAAEEVWVQLAKFNQYSFCKSHAVSYALIAWEAVRLKAHAPLYFWTAALNNNQGMYPRRVYVEAARRAGLAFRLPCVNRSRVVFTPEEPNAIRVGLGIIAGLERELCLAIVAERERQGPYRDLADFRRRLHPGPEALGVLVRCGAFDGFGLPRPALFLEADLQEPNASDADTELFALPAGWSPADYDMARRLRDEWALLGFVVGPPLLSLFRPGLPAGLVTSRDLPAHVGRTVRVAGLVATAREVRTRDGKAMRFVTLEDEWGLIEVTLFPGSCARVPHLFLGPYVASGTVEEQYGVVTLTARNFRLQRDPNGWPGDADAAVPFWHTSDPGGEGM
jgi:DNA-directed DNA polymerase III PolC